MKDTNAVFLIRCMDKKGLVAGITNFFYELGLNILNCQQYTDCMTGQYFMRLKLDLSDLAFSKKDLENRLTEFGKPLGLEWSVHYSDYVLTHDLKIWQNGRCSGTFKHSLKRNWLSGSRPTTLPL